MSATQDDVALRWIDAAAQAEVEAGGVIGLKLGSLPVALYALDGAVFATHDLCTHARAKLSEGYYADGTIECPLHQAAFDVRTGERVGGPRCRNVRTFPVRLDAGRVLVGVPVEESL